ncbi:hypothetical protein Q7P37_002587 [Cladosporium fusiforme]
MLLGSIGAALLTVGAAHGFKHSSPLFMLSTQPSNGGLESAVLNTADKVTDGLLETVGDCAQSKYFIISQPGLTADDFKSETSAATKERAERGEYKQRVEVQSVLSDMDAEKLASKIAGRCGAADSGSHQINTHVSRQAFVGNDKEVVLMKLDPISEEKGRTGALSFFHDQFNTNAPEISEDHMIIILSAPTETFDHAEHPYEMDEPYPSALHQDLKRDIKYSPQKGGNSTSTQDGLPLFEKYQFLSPGIFMGLTVSLLLIVILWVGVSAIAGLEVSYMAFSKEMGPAAQNKGKQQ